MTIPNRYPTTCDTCGCRVPRKSGTVTRKGAQWIGFCAAHSTTPAEREIRDFGDVDSRTEDAWAAITAEYRF
jgi:hypothetical protein